MLCEIGLPFGGAILTFLILIRYCLRFRYFIFGTKIHLILIDNKMRIPIKKNNYRIFYGGVTKRIKKIYNEGVKFYVPRNIETTLIIMSPTNKIVFEGKISGQERREYLIELEEI